MDKINLLYVFLRLDLGGAQEIFLRTISHIDTSRFDVAVCCLAGRGRLVSEVESLGIRVLCLDAADLKNDLSTVLKLAHLIRRHNAHVVYTHLYSRANVYGRLAAILARTPVVVVGAVGYGRVRLPKKRVLDYVLALFTDHFTALSEATREYLCREQGIGPDKVTVIYPGIDVERFADVGQRAAVRQELQIPLDTLVVGAVSRLVPEKGLADLMTAMARILREIPNTRLVIVGDGPLRSQLERSITGLGLQGLVHLTGSRRDIPKLLSAMDVFALPSHREGFGMALVEAMAAGLPVVATDVGGIPEVVEHGVTGFVVPPHDIGALSVNILLLLEDSALRAKMGADGRQQVQQRFTARRAAMQTQDLYLSLLARKGIVFSVQDPCLARIDAG